MIGFQIARGRSVPLLALGVGVLLLAPVTISAPCPTVPEGTLTFQCDGACESGTPCMAAATKLSSASSGSDSSASGDCKCLGKALTAPGGFELLIPFDAAALKPVVNAKPFEIVVGTGRNDTDTLSWVSDSDLARIAPLSGISKSATRVYVPVFAAVFVRFIRGGSSASAFIKGVRANVEVDSKLLAGQSQVSWLVLRNMNLGSTMNDLVANLPSDLQRIDLSNTGLTEFPAALTTAKVLDVMCVPVVTVLAPRLRRVAEDTSRLTARLVLARPGPWRSTTSST
ncbi:hypothetical protein PybrP1_009164 [[Pythium] brassicae (nom. inval.)]|nr:hypothetical protein PybrP1_009164 [[Pythium] brassicae (nom. inval.)]